MNLSVVMDVVNKTSKPLQGMASDSDHYAKKIKKLQQAQSNDSSALTMIASYQEIQKELDKNALEGEEATEKLAKLKAQMDATEEPSAALTNRLAKQAEKVARLSDKHNEYENSILQVSNQMRETGVDVGDLDGEFDRLSQSQINHARNIDSVSERYRRLRTAMAPIQRLNSSIRMPTLGTVKGAAMGGAGALASLAGFGVVMSDTADKVNELSMAANDISMPTGELQALRLQAQAAGAEGEDMDAALKEMNLRWGEMKTIGSGSMNDYFIDTGNGKAYKDLKNAKNAMEAYQVLVREIAAEKDVAKQNFMADEFFGGDSEKMLSVLKAGTDGLSKAKQQLEETGGPISDESVASAAAYTAVLKKLGVIVESLKISALTPAMKELSVIFNKLTENMKNADWRTEAIKKLKATVTNIMNAFKFLGNLILFVSENFRGLIATIAILKVGLIAVNAIIMGNPIGLIVAAIGAAIIAIIYLVDRFIGFDVILKAVGETIGWIWDGIKALINMLPDALIPDGWKASAEAAGDEVDKLNEKLNKIKDKNAKLGITIDETINKTTTNKASIYKPGGIEEQLAKMPKITPLTNQTIKSQAEIAVTIKSEKPINIDKATSERGTNLNLNVGNMMTSY